MLGYRGARDAGLWPYHREPGGMALAAGRRQFLRLSASTGLASFALSCSWPGMTAVLAMERPGTNDLTPALTTLFKDPEGTAAIGRRYLALYPQEADADHLTAALFDTAKPSPTTADALRSELSRQRQQDFRNGQVVVVDGWLLARSEARVCALSALLQQV